MKGREAALAAGRREREARAELEQVRAELAEERSRHHAEEEDLKGELRKVRGQILNEARRLADEEVTKRIAEADEERKMRGVTDDVMEFMRTKQDRIIMNACRYISMTTGKGPLDALDMVWTWLTDEDSYGITRHKLLILGLPEGGWVRYQLSRMTRIHDRNAARCRAEGNPTAVTLDHAEDKQHPDIHPSYSKWRRHYYADYRNTIELVDDDGNVEDVFR